MKKINLPKLTFWRAIGFFIAIIGIYAIIERYAKGLGAVTNLSDNFPWGLWIGFDILCGVGLAAGGFTICAVTYVFNIEKFKPLTLLNWGVTGLMFIALGLLGLIEARRTNR